MSATAKWSKRKKKQYRCPVCGKNPNWWMINEKTGTELLDWEPFDVALAVPAGNYNSHFIYEYYFSTKESGTCLNCGSLFTIDNKILRDRGDVLIPLTRICGRD